MPSLQADAAGCSGLPRPGQAPACRAVAFSRQKHFPERQTTQHTRHGTTPHHTAPSRTHRPAQSPPPFPPRLAKVPSNGTTCGKMACVAYRPPRRKRRHRAAHASSCRRYILFLRTVFHSRGTPLGCLHQTGSVPDPNPAGFLPPAAVGLGRRTERRSHWRPCRGAHRCQWLQWRQLLPGQPGRPVGAQHQLVLRPCRTRLLRHGPAQPVHQQLPHAPGHELPVPAGPAPETDPRPAPAQRRPPEKGAPGPGRPVQRFRQFRRQGHPYRRQPCQTRHRRDHQPRRSHPQGGAQGSQCRRALPRHRPAGHAGRGRLHRQARLRPRPGTVL